MVGNYGVIGKMQNKTKTKKYQWGFSSWEFYKPQRNKKKLAIVFGVVVGLLVTPFTNWLLIPLGKFLNKSLWVYR